MRKTLCKYTVTVTRRDQTMTKIVNEDSFTIGRSMDCTLPLTEESISRVHLMVHRRQDQMWIEDKGSSNGTFVNNVRIAQNTLVNIVPTDLIRIGKSDYVISISLAVEEREESSLSTGGADQTDVVDPLGATQTAAALAEQKVLVQAEALAPTPLPTPSPAAVSKPALKDPFPKDFLPKATKEKEKEEPALEAPPALDVEPVHFESEKILHEARKKGAQIIYEAELKAEKRVQSIYVEARERIAQADQYYQRRVQDAHKEVDRVLTSFQSQGQELIEQARHFAQEIRDEVEVFCQTEKDKAKKEAEEILATAQGDAETLKKEAFEKARSQAEIDAEDLVVSAKAESQDILNFAKQTAEEMLSKARGEMENELKDLISQIENKKKHLQVLKKEEEEFNIRALGEKEETEGKIAELKTELAKTQQELEEARRSLTAAGEEEEDLQFKIQEQTKASQDLEHQIGQLYSDSKTLERRNKEMQEQLGHIGFDIQAAEEKKRLMESEANLQKQQLKERLEKEHQVIMKEAEGRLYEAQLEMTKRLQKLEREMLDEIMSRKEALVKDILIVVETRIAKVLEPAKWDQVSSQVMQGISETIEGKAVTFSENSSVPKQSTSMQRMKKKENFRWMASGVASGVLASVLAIQGYNQVQKDKNPMRTIAAEETRKRREDLERRRFNPVQSPAVKDTYVDSVIYTSGFVAAYQNPDYQQKLYKAASTYLLKTWRVDEDKSIQVLSMSSALIKELNEKRQAIHPDFVKEGIGKMRGLEKESLERMKAVLGSEVRLESYRRFERKFFETEILKK